MSFWLKRKTAQRAAPRQFSSLKVAHSDPARRLARRRGAPEAAAEDHSPKLESNVAAQVLVALFPTLVNRGRACRVSVPNVARRGKGRLSTNRPHHKEYEVVEAREPLLVVRVRCTKGAVGRRGSAGKPARRPAVALVCTKKSGETAPESAEVDNAFPERAFELAAVIADHRADRPSAHTLRDGKIAEPREPLATLGVPAGVRQNLCRRMRAEDAVKTRRRRHTEVGSSSLSSNSHNSHAPE